MDPFNEIVGVWVEDLDGWCFSLTEEELTEFNDPLPGLYLPGQRTPLFPRDREWAIRMEDRTALVQFSHIEAAWNKKLALPNGEWVHTSGPFAGKPLLTTEQFRKYLRWLSPAPAFNMKACDVALAVLHQYLRSLCPYTRHVVPDCYQWMQLVRPEVYPCFDEEKWKTRLDRFILNFASNFVRRDTFHHYRVCVNAMTVKVEKGMDFRILDWHQRFCAEGYVPTTFDLRWEDIKLPDDF